MNRKAITLSQPRTILVAIGVKPFETRSWATRYRGRLAIHAGKAREGRDLRGDDPQSELAVVAAGDDFETLPMGVVVCTARLVECWTTEQMLADDLADAFGDYGRGRFAWYLHGIRQIDPPGAAYGKQGLWEWIP